MIPTLYYRIKDKMHHIGASWDKLAFNMDDVQNKAHEYINPEPKRTMEDNSLIATPEYVLAHYGESVNRRMRSNRPDETDMDIAEMLSVYTINFIVQTSLLQLLQFINSMNPQPCWKAKKRFRIIHRNTNQSFHLGNSPV